MNIKILLDIFNKILSVDKILNNIYRQNFYLWFFFNKFNITFLNNWPTKNSHVIKT